MYSQEHAHNKDIQENTFCQQILLISSANKREEGKKLFFVMWTKAKQKKIQGKIFGRSNGARRRTNRNGGERRSLERITGRDVKIKIQQQTRKQENKKKCKHAKQIDRRWCVNKAVFSAHPVTSVV